MLLAGGQSLMTESFGRLLEPACNVVGRVPADGDLAEAAERLKPDVIVLRAWRAWPASSPGTLLRRTAI